MTAIFPTILFDDHRQPTDVGVRLGLRRWLGFGHLPVWRRRAAAVRQGIRRDLLQGAKNRARHANASLGQVARSARCRSLD